jgi:2-succinyl-5-enolpyruvyl-6-hydroxy-3-cyclohexene-1-carboxylate synthase
LSGDGFPEQVTALAQLGRLPLLAEALSGVRFGPHAAHAEGTILSGYETFLQKEVIATWEPPDLIVRFGAMPISKLLNQYLAAQPTCRHIQFSHTGIWQDDTHTTSDFIWATRN